MYINCEVMGDSVYVWERHPDGRRLVTYPSPWSCYVEDPNGKHTTLHGERASFFEFSSRFELMAAIKAAQARGRKVFEGDIPPDLKILSQYYPYSESSIPKLHVCYLDIEVDYRTNSYERDYEVVIRRKGTTEEITTQIGKVRDARDYTDYEIREERTGEWISAESSDYMYCGQTGFASVDRPYAPINAVALSNDWTDETYVIAVPPPSWGTDPDKWDAMLNPEFRELGEIILVKDEKELLVLFLSLIQDADALIGWNSEFFDFPYIMARVDIVLGKRGLRKLSFDGAPLPKQKQVEIMGKINYTASYGGRILMDYMQLFKKFEMAARPSYKLEAITEEIMPDLRKLEYDGTLEQLYRRDFNHFIRYNLRDTECLRGFEKVKGYVGVANLLYHMSTARFRDVAGTLRTADMSIINYCHDALGVIVPNAPEVTGGDDEDDEDGAQGAYVLEPKAGMHDWIGSIDINSLYPSAIRSINISPEMLLGQFVEAITAFEHIMRSSDAALTLQFEGKGGSKVMKASEWRQWLIDNQYAISGYGTVFDQSRGQGVIPSILTDWFAKRKHYQKLKAQASNELDELIAKYK